MASTNSHLCRFQQAIFDAQYGKFEVFFCSPIVNFYIISMVFNCASFLEHVVKHNFSIYQELITNTRLLVYIKEFSQIIRVPDV